MTSNRPYRKALVMNSPLQELRDGAGSQFDPGLVDLFFDKDIYAYLPQQQ
jgi:HD-GYP domain-containing protein (c-di-GMP phosphodiesterase class II)